jgi:hypothetical protein
MGISASASPSEISAKSSSLVTGLSLVLTWKLPFIGAAQLRAIREHNAGIDRAREQPNNKSSLADESHPIRAPVE